MTYTVELLENAALLFFGKEIQSCDTLLGEKWVLGWIIYYFLYESERRLIKAIKPCNYTNNTIIGIEFLRNYNLHSGNKITRILLFSFILIHVLIAGLFDVIPARALEGLTAEDLRLLLNGVGDINVTTLISYTSFNDESGEAPDRLDSSIEALTGDR